MKDGVPPPPVAGNRKSPDPFSLKGQPTPSTAFAALHRARLLTHLRGKACPQRENEVLLQLYKIVKLADGAARDVRVCPEAKSGTGGGSSIIILHRP